MDRKGYRRWRTTLGTFHASTAGEILEEVGYDDDTIERVRSLLRKERLKADPDVQLLEDVACLVFLDFQLAEFATRHDEEKLIDILRKTWKKMSSRGHQAAGMIELTPELKPLVKRALAGTDD